MTDKELIELVREMRRITRSVSSEHSLLRARDALTLIASIEKQIDAELERREKGEGN